MASSSVLTQIRNAHKRPKPKTRPVKASQPKVSTYTGPRPKPGPAGGKGAQPVKRGKTPAGGTGSRVDLGGDNVRTRLRTRTTAENRGADQDAAKYTKQRDAMLKAGKAAARTGQSLNTRAAGAAAANAQTRVPGTTSTRAATAGAAARSSGAAGGAAPVGGAGGSSGAGGGSAGSGGSGAAAATPTDAPETVEQYVNRLYDPAFRSIARNRAALESQLTGNQASQQRFEEWLAAKRGEGRTWLQDMHAKANEHAAQSQAGVSGLADQARAAAGATTAQFDPATTAGAGGAYNQQIASGNEQMLNTRVAAGTASTNSNLANFDAQALVADALNTNRRQQLLAEYNKTKRGYDDDEMKLRMQVGTSVREEEANRANQEFMNAYKEKELGIKQGALEVDQLNAQTRAWDAQARVEYNNAKLQLEKVKAERNWTTAQFNAKLKAEKLKIEQRAGARAAKDNNAQAKATDSVSKAITSWLPSTTDPLGRPIPRSLTSLNGAERSSISQRAIVYLKARHPRLTAKQALQVITGTVGPNALLDDNGQPNQQLITLINTSFLKGQTPRTPGQLFSGF